MLFNEKLEKQYLVLFLLFSLIVISYGSYTDYISFENSITIKNILGLFITYFAGITGVICVVLAARENIWNYCFGIISVSLWLLYVVVWSPLIWDGLINVVYLILNFYGLYYWMNPPKEQKNENKNTALTRKLTQKEKIIYTVLSIVCISLLTVIGKNIGRYDNELQAFTDSSSTVFAILGQWFMSLKVLENWYMWIIVNIISIPLYISIESYTLAMVWVAYLINAVYGYIKWKRNMQINTKIG